MFRNREFQSWGKDLLAGWTMAWQDQRVIALIGWLAD